jgi:hypothetical protein
LIGIDAAPQKSAQTPPVTLFSYLRGGEEPGENIRDALRADHVLTPPPALNLPPEALTPADTQEPKAQPVAVIVP